MLAKEIDQYIEQTGLKRKKIAEDAGLTPQQLSEICKGKRKINVVEYFNLCKALNVSVNYFMDKVIGR